MKLGRALVTASIVGTGVLVVSIPRAGADDAAPCNSWEIEYALAANLQLSETVMGAGDGTYRIGPGRLVLRFDNRGGQPGGVTKMIAYEMKSTFTVDAKALLGGTKVASDTQTTATPNVCGVLAEGVYSDRTLRWTTVVSGMHTAGKVTCEGSFCGRFGAPPRGTSDVQPVAHPVAFKPFEFAPDLKTFTMAYAITDKSTSPNQISKVALAGRETRRSCVAVKPCP